MKRKIKNIIIITIFLLGLFIFIYPKITDYLYNKNVNILEKRYFEIIDEFNDKNNTDNKLDELYNLLKEENDKIYNEKQITFLNHTISYEKNLINLKDYELLDNVFGFLEIPSIDVNLPIYLGANKSNMNLGAVHLTGSSYPIGGNNTNSVIAAHRGYYKTLMFRHIDNIKIGDELYIKNFKEILKYKAIKTAVIKPNEFDKLLIEENKDMVTIISCHPYPRNYLRYVVFFERIN